MVRVGEEALATASNYPLIDQKVHDFNLLAGAFSQYTDNNATRAHLEARLVHDPGDRTVRFVILNYYYELANFNADLKEEYIGHLRKQFREDLAFFVRLRPIEDCTEPNDIEWEITNSCAIRDWPRAQGLPTTTCYWPPNNRHLPRSLWELSVSHDIRRIR